MSSEDVPSSVIFRGSFDDINFKIFSLLSSDGSNIQSNNIYHLLCIWFVNLISPSNTINFKCILLTQTVKQGSFGRIWRWDFDRWDVCMCSIVRCRVDAMVWIWKSFVGRFQSWHIFFFFLPWKIFCFWSTLIISKTKSVYLFVVFSLNEQNRIISVLSYIN